MVTSEDRKEAVKALHDLCDGCETVSDYDLAKALCLVAVSRYAYSSDSVLRLADLIDPEPERTCEILHDDNLSEQYGGPMARCSYCVAALPEEFIGPYYYCPCCGSKNKVVE